MRAEAAGLAIVLLLLCMASISYLPGAAAAGIPGDDDHNGILSERELVTNIFSYLHGESDLVLEDVRDAAHVYVYWNGAPRTVTDTADRTVTLYRPVKTIVVLSSDSARAIRIVGDEAKIIGVSDTVQKFPIYFPLMSQQPVVGTWKAVDWEAIVALDPDLVITYPTGAINAELAAEKLEPFGITVIGLYLYVSDEYDQIFGELEKLAVLLEREEEAERYIMWHDEQEERVQDFVAGKEKPDVFMTYTAGAIGTTTEIKSYGPGTIDYLMCERAGGRIVTEQATTAYPKVNAEWVLAENPDIMIIKGGNVFGWWDDEATPADLIDQLLDGKSWETMNATMNNQIYAVPWSITNGFEHIYGVVLLTKIFYPDFPVDPTEVYQEYLKEFMRVDYPEGEGKVLAYSDSTTLTT